MLGTFSAAGAEEGAFSGAEVFHLKTLAQAQPVTQPDAPLAPPPPPPPAEEAPNIHGYVAIKFTNSYITPRGLVVQNDDLTIQPIIGLVMPLSDQWTFVGGIWNNITTAQNDEEVGPGTKWTRSSRSPTHSTPRRSSARPTFRSSARPMRLRRSTTSSSR
jgi:hypothetical protein